MGNREPANELLRGKAPELQLVSIPDTSIDWPQTERYADAVRAKHYLSTRDEVVLLARLPGLEALDVVATERVLAAGFHQRLFERHLPGIEEHRAGAETPHLTGHYPPIRWRAFELIGRRAARHHNVTMASRSFHIV